MGANVDVSNRFGIANTLSLPLNEEIWMNISARTKGKGSFEHNDCIVCNKREKL